MCVDFKSVQQQIHHFAGPQERRQQTGRDACDVLSVPTTLGTTPLSHVPFSMFNDSSLPKEAKSSTMTSDLVEPKQQQPKGEGVFNSLRNDWFSEASSTRDWLLSRVHLVNICFTPKSTANAQTSNSPQHPQPVDNKDSPHFLCLNCGQCGEMDGDNAQWCVDKGPVYVLQISQL